MTYAAPSFRIQGAVALASLDCLSTIPRSQFAFLKSRGGAIKWEGDFAEPYGKVEEVVAVMAVRCALTRTFKLTAGAVQ